MMATLEETTTEAMEGRMSDPVRDPDAFAGMDIAALLRDTRALTSALRGAERGWDWARVEWGTEGEYAIEGRERDPEASAREADDLIAKMRRDQAAATAARLDQTS